MKRFWQDAAVVARDEGLTIELDGRVVRTPGRALLIAPTRALAEAIAGEWRAVPETIDPRAMPLTGLANAAIDRIAPERAGFAAGLAAYGESDLLCYRADTPAPLVERQAARWDPVLDWARGRYDVRFEIATGVMHRPQPMATVTRLGDAVAALDPFELAGLAPIITISGSLVLGLALIDGAMPAEAVWDAAQVDEAWQAEQWGEDALAVQAREARRRDFDAGARVLALIGR